LHLGEVTRGSPLGSRPGCPMSFLIQQLLVVFVKTRNDRRATYKSMRSQDC